VLTALGAHAAGFATARRCLRFLVLNNSDFEQELTLDEKAVARGRSFQLSYGFHRDITIYSLFVNLVTLFSLHPVY